MSFLTTIWDAIWFFLSIFFFIAYLTALFSIITDLFRDRNLNGISKAIWFLLLIFLPFVTAVFYIIIRGKGMGDRSAQQASAANAAAADYIRSVASSPIQDVAQAKALLDSGAITPEEYAALKHSALKVAAR